jgi:hypothetical protein
VVESVHPIGSGLMVVIVDQTYTGRDGAPRDARARHTHTYVVAFHAQQLSIVAGQNTVRMDW